jgi:uncharacterized membrane protein
VPFDATPLDWIAFVWFLIVWLGYGWIADHLPGRAVSINHRLVALREIWLTNMIARDNRIMDAQLVGHTMQSVTFFASTTMLVLAGLIGMFGAFDHVYDVVAQMSLAARTSKAFFAAKLLLLVALFVHGFFQFTWSLRQFNYLCAMIGSAPIVPATPELGVAAGRACATVLTEAATSFNAGLRDYYFALAVLAWLIQPWLFLGFTAWMLAILIHRQVRSRSAAAIEAQLRHLAAPGGRPPKD